MKVRREGALLSEEAPRSGAELTELPQKDGWGKRLLRADKLVRNLAVVGAMLLTVIAVKNAGSPDAQSVFGALQASTEMEWDESGRHFARRHPGRVERKGNGHRL